MLSVIPYIKMHSKKLMIPKTVIIETKYNEKYKVPKFFSNIVEDTNNIYPFTINYP